jgi:hypothetical protein
MPRTDRAVAPGYSFVRMQSCVIGIAVLAIVLDMDRGLLDGLPAARGQGHRSARKQQPSATVSGVAKR